MDKSWELRGGHLVREFVFADFLAAMAFVNQLAEVAERAGHHPDIFIQWNKVRLELWTHTAGGVTAKDLRLAEEIDRMI
jgi:4a-hydroxytetrahydrobiopterin dehydratase